MKRLSVHRERKWLCARTNREKLRRPPIDNTFTVNRLPRRGGGESCTIGGSAFRRWCVNIYNYVSKNGQMSKDLSNQSECTFYELFLRECWPIQTTFAHEDGGRRALTVPPWRSVAEPGKSMNRYLWYVQTAAFETFVRPMTGNEREICPTNQMESQQRISNAQRLSAQLYIIGCYPSVFNFH